MAIATSSRIRRLDVQRAGIDGDGIAAAGGGQLGSQAAGQRQKLIFRVRTRERRGQIAVASARLLSGQQQIDIALSFGQLQREDARQLLDLLLHGGDDRLQRFVRQIAIATQPTLSKSRRPSRTAARSGEQADRPGAACAGRVFVLGELVDAGFVGRDGDRGT